MWIGTVNADIQDVKKIVTAVTAIAAKPDTDEHRDHPSLTPTKPTAAKPWLPGRNNTARPAL